jgi:hypothetical protein
MAGRGVADGEWMVGARGGNIVRWHPSPICLLDASEVFHDWTFHERTRVLGMGGHQVMAAAAVIGQLGAQWLGLIMHRMVSGMRLGAKSLADR